MNAKGKPLTAVSTGHEPVLNCSTLIKVIEDINQSPIRIALLLNPIHNSGLSEQFIDIAESNSIGFEQAIARAIGQFIDKPHDAKVINIANTVWLLPAITAAKHAIHPHAFINGLATAQQHELATQQALIHAKRQHMALLTQYSDSVTSLHKLQQFAAFISAIASRQRPRSDGSQSGYWFSELHQSRVAAFNSQIESQGYQSIILTQGSGLIVTNPLINLSRLWLPLRAASVSELQQQLTAVISQLAAIDQANNAHSGGELLTLIKQHLQAYQQQQAKLCGSDDSVKVNDKVSVSAVLMATSHSALIDEAKALLSALANQEERLDYKTPAGSCFRQHSLKQPANEQSANDSGLSFVYPGVGTVYHNMFHNLGQTFPGLFAELEKQGDLHAMLQADKVYTPTSAMGEMSLSELAISGVGVSYLLTKLLTQEFKIQPRFALGYSMGEAAMWASLGVWQQPHNLIEATQTSSIFTADISGALNCVRQDWQLSQDEPIQWNSFVTRASQDELKPFLAQYPKAYIAIIQGDTCVVAGCETSCKALLKQAGKRGIASNKVTAMHTPPALQIIEQVKGFYHQPLMANLPTEITFITAMQASPVVLTADAIAQSIADTFCHQLNFTQLISKAYQHGSRLFVEVGADRQTTTLIDKILSNQHCQGAKAVAVNAKGADANISLLKCLAQLLIHQVPMSFTPFINSIDWAMRQDIAKLSSMESAPMTPAHQPLSEGEPH
ncbi:PfaB family protein [Shewanella gaetbuli]|uniref:PfaB family protein n=1 Tax=Shewanella gaetbuli TaxID=220752 RepID=A0A9X2CLN5_9GAMM|nr:PfaB family protein [Shewanella gaetbuli]MCL1144346.1 PfaB family protein [Shewanella gaetbuli]